MPRDAIELLDLPVISTATGSRLGKVHGLLFEPGQHLLFGFVLDGEGGSPRLFLNRERIKSIGRDAITVEDDHSPEVFEGNERARDLAVRGGRLTGMKVFTEDGNQIGQIDRVMLNEDGSIDGYHSSSGLLGLGTRRDISPTEIVSAGADAIVISSPPSSHEANR